MNTVYRGRREVAKQLLDELGCTYSLHQSGLFIWANVPAGVKDVEHWTDEILYGAHVFITPGFIFGENGKSHVRISLCATIEKLKEAVDRIKQWKAGKETKMHHTNHKAKV